MEAAFDALPDEDLSNFANQLIAARMLGAELRNQVQDHLWEGSSAVETSKRIRRDIARALRPIELFHNWDNFSNLLNSVFVIRDESLVSALLGRKHESLLESIHRHFVRFPEDADVERLFEDLHIFDLSDKRFAVFLEGLVTADVQVDYEAQQAIVAAINGVLRSHGSELRQTGEDGGYPVFGLVSLNSARGKPKNLIFASLSKPDIRFRDAVNNDIEIVSNNTDILVYDQPLGASGLTWRQLQDWWAQDTHETDPDQAKRSLYRRLLSCLPSSSPPQRTLFEAFFKNFGKAVPDLPALLPEVWLHWDPKTVIERGPQALLNHRMDFLMLLPAGGRIVIEVDGAQHYADEAGHASREKYARLVAGNRELQLAGYEVYRFAGTELTAPGAQQLVGKFFCELFRRWGVSLPQEE